MSLIRKLREKDSLVIGNIVIQLKKTGDDYARLSISAPEDVEIFHGSKGEVSRQDPS